MFRQFYRSLYNGARSACAMAGYLWVVPAILVARKGSCGATRGLYISGAT